MYWTPTLTRDPSSPHSFSAPRSGGVWGGQSYWGWTASSWRSDHFCQSTKRADKWWGRRGRGSKIEGRRSWCTQTLSECQVSLEESISVRVSADVDDARTLETLETLWTLTTRHCTGHPHLTRLAPARRSSAHSSHPHTAIQWKYNMSPKWEIFSWCGRYLMFWSRK